MPDVEPQSLFVWFLVVAVFVPYTWNMQATTLQLGRALVNDETGAGIQDAISPRSHIWSNASLPVVLFLYAGACFLALPWHLAAGAFLLTLLVVVPIVTRFLMFRPMSDHYVERIRKGLRTRIGEYKRTGDEIRAMTAADVLTMVDAHVKGQRRPGVGL